MSPVDDQLESLGEPTWDIAHLFPNQGDWSEAEYVALHTNRLVEFSEGSVEVLPMPTEWHQLIVARLYQIFFAFISSRDLGTIVFAPFRIRLWAGKFREPDLAFMRRENNPRRGKKFWQGADLVIEIVSEDDPARDLDVKRAEYAKAGISEYWIVNPLDESITVLVQRVPSQPYEVAGVYVRGAAAASELLVGLMVQTEKLFQSE
jgi:Uma2 family endonuclease